MILGGDRWVHWIEQKKEVNNCSSKRAGSWENLGCQQWELMEFLPGFYHWVTWYNWWSTLRNLYSLRPSRRTTEREKEQQGLTSAFGSTAASIIEKCSLPWARCWGPQLLLLFLLPLPVPQHDCLRMVHKKMEKRVKRGKEGTGLPLLPTFIWALADPSSVPQTRTRGFLLDQSTSCLCLLLDLGLP